jgi:hypothetical protein
MNSEQIKDMHFLYNAVYNEELREKFNEYNNTIYDEDIVEVATEYFYSYGLNEDGIDILIKNVGLESFVEYVYDLSEDLYVLTEAKRKYSGPSYDEVKAGIEEREAKALAKKKAKKNASEEATEKKEVERKEPESRGAESQAKAEQPKSKKPVRDAIARNIFRAVDAYKAGMERHKSATATAGRLASVTREAGRRAGEHVKKHGLKSLANEEVEIWVNQLIGEGCDLSEYTWDEMSEIYEDSRSKIRPKTDEELEAYAKALRNLADTATKVRGPEPSQRKKPRKRTTDMRNVQVHEDLYDVILSYLLDEGYAESVEQAEVIMVNMSEEWRESIVEGFKPTNYNSGGGRKHGQIKNQIKKLNKSGKTGEAMAVHMVNRLQDEPSGREENLETSRRNKMKPDTRARRDAQRDEKNDRRGR